MQQSKKFGPSMNIICLKNTRFYKDQIFIPQNPKKNEILKIPDSFHSCVSSPPPPQYSLTKIIDIIIILFYYICAMVSIILINCLSISFQIHAVIFFVSVVNNNNLFSFHKSEQMTRIYAEAATLVEAFTEKEIKNALDHMNISSTPGPDGLPVEFYKCF
jgi:hypothetical protein